MTFLQSYTQLAILVFATASTGMSFAEESVKDEHKNNGAGNAVSNADLTGHADGGFSFAVNTHTAMNAHSQQKVVSDIHTYKHMEERRRQMQEAQLEAFKRHLHERKQRSAAANRSGHYVLPEAVQARRKEYIKLMNERRTLMKKMMEERRQAAQKRHEAMLLKMHQTSTTPDRGEQSLG